MGICIAISYTKPAICVTCDMAEKASIVTGGAQGIGQAFEKVLLEDGYKVSVSVYYHPRTNLRECNDFIHVCLFAGQSHVTITHDALDLTIQSSLPRTPDMGHHRTPPPTHGPLLVTCGGQDR